MKKSALFFPLFVLLSFLSYSQNKVNLIIFSEDSDPFFVFVNGVKQNFNPESNVKVTDLSPNVSLRIEFTDIALPQIKQSMALEPNIEHTFRIKKDVKKQVKLRYFGGVPLAEAASGIPTVAYHTADDATASNTSNGTNSNSYGNTTTINSTTVTTVNTQVNPTMGTDNVSVNMGMGGISMNVNVTGMDQTSQMNMNSSTSTTVTQQSSGSYSDPDQKNSAAAPAKTKSSTCQFAISQASFNKMKESIESKPFSDTKMSTAKVATKNACLSVNQVKEITKLFNMDDDKLEYAKYAYPFCVDKANYYQVGDIFSFSTSTEALNNFIAEQ